MTSWAIAVALAVLSQAAAGPPQSQPAQTPSTQASVARFEIGGDISFVADALPRKDAVELRPRASLDVPWFSRFIVLLSSASETLSCVS